MAQKEHVLGKTAGLMIFGTNSLSPQINLRADIFRGISSTSSWQLKEAGEGCSNIFNLSFVREESGLCRGATKVADSSTDIPAYGDYFPFSSNNDICPLR
jgi:hypothetical protein